MPDLDVDLSFNNYRSRELLEADNKRLKKQLNLLHTKLRQEKVKTADLHARNEKLMSMLIEINSK